MKITWRKCRPFVFPIAITAIVFLLMRFVFLFGYVPSQSMEPTLEKGSFILGSRIYFSLHQGDIIIFQHDGRLLVKRIAALPGETVDLDALEYMAGYEKPVRESRYLTVPNESYYVMGDNTQNSLDSRYWEDPFVHQDEIVAKLIVP